MGVHRLDGRDGESRRGWVPSVVLVALAAAGVARAQTAPLHGHWEPVALDSGTIENRGPQEAIVYGGAIALDPATPWIQVEFDAASLPKGSAVRVTSLLDGDSQTLHAVQLEQWNHRTAFFNGSTLAVELIAGPWTAGNAVRIERVLAGDPVAAADPLELICGPTDDRAPTADARVARMILTPYLSACTAWIIDAPAAGNDKLHLSAGHCFPAGAILQFGAPASFANCSLRHPPAANQYTVNATTVASVNGGVGNDWAVFRCFPNPGTGLTTFQAQGAAFTLAAAVPAAGNVTVSGYGTDGTDANNAPGAEGNCTCDPATGTGTRNQVLQSHGQTIVGTPANEVHFLADICGGNSGSPLVLNATGEAIAIVTHGGCHDAAFGEVNYGNKVTHPALQAAIAALAAPPGGVPGDECAGALSVTDGIHAGFTNAGATTSSAWPCGPGGADVWFTYAAVCGGATTFYTCSAGTNFDSTIQVFSGPCNALVPIACNDDFCGLSSLVTIGATAGTIYHVRVGGFSSAQGNFDLGITPNCPTPGVGVVSFAQNFEGGGFGVYAETDAAGAPAATLWHADGSCDGIAGLPAVMGTTAAAYNQGNLGVYNYATGGAPNAGAIQSPVIVSSPGAVLSVSFDMSKQTEGNGGPDFDRCFLDARPAGGAWGEEAIFVGNNACGVSFAVTAALSIPGGAWQHRFRFDTVDGSDNLYRGWVVDNVVARQFGAAGFFANLPTGCGGLRIVPEGAPVLGGTITYTLGNATGATLVWLGAPLAVALCPPAPCTLGADLALVTAGAVYSVTVPQDLSLVGASFRVQGVDIGPAGGCGAALIGLPFRLSDTIETTLD